MADQKHTTDGALQTRASMARESPVLISTRQHPPGAFSDRRVFLVPAGASSPHCASFWDESTAVASEQDDDGPTHLIVGALADDAALGRASQRFDLPLVDLIAFRDAQRHTLGGSHD